MAPSGWSATAWVAAGVALVALFGGAWFVTVDEPIDALLRPFGIADEDQSSGPELGVNLTEVSDHPEAMWGRTVTVSGEVQAVVAGRILLVGSHYPFVGDVVLVAAEDDVRDVDVGEVVQVTGVVRRWDDAPGEVRRAAQGEASDYDSKAYLASAEIDTTPPDEDLFAGDKEDDSTSDGPGVRATADEVRTNVNAYIGEVVTISAEVEKVLSDHAVMIDDERLLVVGQGLSEAFVEARLDVTGTVVRFDVDEAERRLGLELDDSLARYEGQPAVLVRDADVVR